MYSLALQLLKVLLMRDQRNRFYLTGQECLRSMSAYCRYTQYHTLQDALTLLESYKDPLKADVHAIPKLPAYQEQKLARKHSSSKACH